MTDQQRHPVMLAIGAFVAMFATIASPIYYTGQINAQQAQGQVELRRALNDLSGEVHELTKAVGNSATSTADLARHVQDMDHDFGRRLEVLEKDRAIESYKRN